MKKENIKIEKNFEYIEKQGGRIAWRGEQK